MTTSESATVRHILIITTISIPIADNWNIAVLTKRGA